MTEPIDVELLSDAFYHDPYPTYARLRETAPAHRVTPTGQWLISRYDDVANLFPDHAKLSSSGFQRNYFEQLDPAIRQRTRTLEARGNAANVLTTDPPEHTRLRRALQASFTVKRIDAMHALIQTAVDEILDAVVLRQQDTFDFIEQIASPLPAIVLCDLLGVDSQDRHRMQQWSTDLLMFMSRSDPNNELTPDRAAQFDSSLDEWQSFLEEFIDERRRAPREDLATALIQFGDREDKLSTAELVSNFVLFMGAGHETTTSLLGNTIHALLTHPEQMQDVRQTRRLVPAAIEETLRWENPVQRLRRTAARDFVLHHQPIRQGDSVELVPGSANRDPAHFEDAHAFDIHRDTVDHLSFGKGIHFCVGARLARAETGIALNAIFDRFSRLQLTERWRPDWKRSSLLRRLETLEIAATQ
jgi:cytochrome P450